MKQLSILCTILIFLTLASCTSNEGPEYPAKMLPTSIQTQDANGDNQTFGYDDKGRIVSWNCISGSPNSTVSYSAHYSYTEGNTIKVRTEETVNELWEEQHRVFEETIQLKNGRAAQAEGTFIYTIHSGERTSEMRKTYRLIFDYLPSNHLNTVEHFEVYGIVDEINDNEAWRWKNQLVWENGNLKEFLDYQGNSTVDTFTKYEYSADKVANPLIMPMVTNRAHHLPLLMQGVFGANSVNLVKSASWLDNKSNPYLSEEYSYEIENSRISKYTATRFINSAASEPVTYTVTWAGE